MKKVLLAAAMAGALTLSLVPTQSSAAVHVGIGPGGVGVRVGPGWHHGWHKHRKCAMVKKWRHGHPVWVKKCWW